MVKFLFLFILAFNARQISAQQDSIDIYINRLNWNSFSVGYNYIPSFHFGNEMERIVIIEDSTKIARLINRIRDSSKTVAIHAILSKIFYPFYSTFSANGSRCVYNDLPWRISEEWGLHWQEIESEDVERIYEYWILVKKLRGRAEFWSY